MDEVLDAVRAEDLGAAFADALARIMPDEQQVAAQQALDVDTLAEMDGPAMCVALMGATEEQAWEALERARGNLKCPPHAFSQRKGERACWKCGAPPAASVDPAPQRT